GVVRGLDLDALGHVEIDVMAIAELELQLAALRVGAIADAGDLEDLGVTIGHAGHEVGDERALHAPVAARRLAVVRRLDRDAAVLERVGHEVRQAERQRALRALDAEDAVVDRGSDPARDLHRLLADAAHQNTSASTSPPTFCVRASLSESTPRGVETMVMPRPLRITGSSLLPE